MNPNNPIDEFYTSLSLKEFTKIVSELKKSGFSNYDEVRIIKNPILHRFELTFTKNDKKKIIYFDYKYCVENSAYNELKEELGGDARVAGFAYDNMMKRFRKEEK